GVWPARRRPAGGGGDRHVSLITRLTQSAFTGRYFSLFCSSFLLRPAGRSKNEELYMGSAIEHESADSNQQWLGYGHDRGAGVRYPLPAGAGHSCAAAAGRQLALLRLWRADLRTLSADQPRAAHAGDTSADRAATSGFAPGTDRLDRDLGADGRPVRGAWPLCWLPLAAE